MSQSASGRKGSSHRQSRAACTPRYLPVSFLGGGCFSVFKKVHLIPSPMTQAAPNQLCTFRVITDGLLQSGAFNRSGGAGDIECHACILWIQTRICFWGLRLVTVLTLADDTARSRRPRQALSLSRRPGCQRYGSDLLTCQVPGRSHSGRIPRSDLPCFAVPSNLRLLTRAVQHQRVLVARRLTDALCIRTAGKRELNIPKEELPRQPELDG